jgi:ABC-2 type transport system ATP-binding protein
MEQQLNANSLIVAFNNAPDIDSLLQVSGVDHAEQLADGRIRIHYSDTDPAEALAEASVSRHWRLCELAPERRTLEQIFIELTCSETPLREDAA